MHLTFNRLTISRHGGMQLFWVGFGRCLLVVSFDMSRLYLTCNSFTSQQQVPIFFLSVDRVIGYVVSIPNFWPFLIAVAGKIYFHVLFR